MSTLRTRMIASSLQTFFEKNKKVIISATVLFIVGIIVGITYALRAVDGSFERVIRSEVETGAAKVFFFSLLGIIGGYAIILISGVNNKTVFLICIPFTVLGFFLGKYSCALVGRYEGFGVLNLLLVYLPFFLITFVLMVIASAAVLSAGCTDYSANSSLKPSFVKTLKILGINAACSLVLFLIVGSITGVIIVSLF
ncbi:MAG: hypothetical protein NC037_05205 [Bacteroides sp.]|nr:hypothetical protein [Bacillota bacterium]MCM1393929.1 hypothetical protein [[Eubacterium] siraeum]MCM1455904.1 hypothetical protein [Bacteroides sp.]